ncbi:MAG TPA: hypothetical protein VGQ72_03240 [Pyrinomonadaceae bacterium]|nr:hypothetical protein [Pyrinomonadaceae bacterium]
MTVKLDSFGVICNCPCIVTLIGASNTTIDVGDIIAWIYLDCARVVINSCIVIAFVIIRIATIHISVDVIGNDLETFIVVCDRTVKVAFRALRVATG